MKLLEGHPNIVRLHQTVMNLGRLAVIMEYVPGVSLRQYRDLPEHTTRILFPTDHGRHPAPAQDERCARRLSAREHFGRWAGLCQNH